MLYIVLSNIFYTLSFLVLIPLCLYEVELWKRQRTLTRQDLSRFIGAFWAVFALFLLSLTLNSMMGEFSRGHPFNFEFVLVSFLTAIMGYFPACLILILDFFFVSHKIRKRLRELDALETPPPIEPGG